MNSVAMSDLRYFLLLDKTVCHFHQSSTMIAFPSSFNYKKNLCVTFPSSFKTIFLLGIPGQRKILSFSSTGIVTRMDPRSSFHFRRQENSF
jgi:hypothetical protein